jgi:hypothetical protein
MQKYLLLLFHKITGNTLETLNRRRNWEGLVDTVSEHGEGRKEREHFTLQKLLLRFSLVLFYLHNLGLSDSLSFLCVDNCFVVSALTLSDSAFGRLTAKSIGRR